MKLAIEGGTPLRQTPFSNWPIYGEEEKELLRDALDQGQWWRVTGKHVELFEKEFADYHHSPYALTVNSGTTAIELALMVLDIGPGDEVIVPAFTFVSTSLAVQKVGATPIVVDVDLDTYCMDLTQVKSAITENTKAIIPVHMSGHMIDMVGLKSIVDPLNIHIVQDAAHAHGSEIGDKKVGDWECMSCFSFQNFKLMTAGEGGIVLFPTEEMRQKAFLLHSCGRPENDTKYRHVLLGSNYRMGEFAAAVLRAQLKRLPEQNAKRNNFGKKLAGMLESNNMITMQSRDSSVNVHPYYMTMFTLNESIDINRDEFVKALVGEGIPAFRAYPSLIETEAFWLEPHMSSTLPELTQQCPNSMIISKRGVWIHHRVLLGDEQDLRDVVSAIEKVLKCMTEKAETAELA